MNSHSEPTKADADGEETTDLASTLVGPPDASVLPMRRSRILSKTQLRHAGTYPNRK